MGCGDRCVASSRGLCVPRGVRWYVYLSRCPYRLLQLCQGWDWRGWTPAETAFPQRVRSNVREKQTAENTGSRMLMICSLDAKADNTPVLFLVVSRARLSVFVDPTCVPCVPFHVQVEGGWPRHRFLAAPTPFAVTVTFSGSPVLLLGRPLSPFASLYCLVRCTNACQCRRVSQSQRCSSALVCVPCRSSG